MEKERQNYGNHGSVVTDYFADLDNNLAENSFEDQMKEIEEDKDFKKWIKK